MRLSILHVITNCEKRKFCALWETMSLLDLVDMLDLEFVKMANVDFALNVHLAIKTRKF